MLRGLLAKLDHSKILEHAEVPNAPFPQLLGGMLVWVAVWFNVGELADTVFLMWLPGAMRKKLEIQLKEPKADKLRFDFRRRSLSFLHAVVGTVWSLFHILTAADDYELQPADWRQASAQMMGCFTIGYFAWDILDIIRNWSDDSLQWMVHALVCMGAFVGAMTNVVPPVHYAVPNLLVAELSSPFLSLRWVCKHTGFGDSTYATVISALFAVTFYAVRLVFHPLSVFPCLSRTCKSPTCSDFRRFGYNFAMVTSVLLNGYWGIRIFQMVLRPKTKEPGKDWDPTTGTSKEIASKEAAD